MATILVIEHNEKSTRLMQNVFGSLGHTILHAGTAFDGMQQANCQPLDMVLLDLDLPDLDGKVVASALRTRPGMQRVPIIAFGAQNDAITRGLVEAFGCSGLILRPVDDLQLSDQLAGYLD